MKPVVAIDARHLRAVCGGGEPAMQYTWGPPEHYDLNRMAPGNYVLNSGSSVESGPASSASSFRMGPSSDLKLGSAATCRYGVDWVARAQTPLGPVTLTSCNSPPK